MTAPPGETVTITFTDFVLDYGYYYYDYETYTYDYDLYICNYDYVKIYEGEGTGGTVLLDNSCGDSVPNSVTSTTNKATLVFKSDGYWAMKGFEAELSDGVTFTTTTRAKTKGVPQPKCIEGQLPKKLENFKTKPLETLEACRDFCNEKNKCDYFNWKVINTNT